MSIIPHLSNHQDTLHKHLSISFAKVPDLASNSDNWLLDDSPDVYLYGSLMHSAPYLQEDARITVWAQLYSAAVARLNESSDRSRHSGSGLKLKVRGLG